MIGERSRRVGSSSEALQPHPSPRRCPLKGGGSGTRHCAEKPQVGCGGQGAPGKRARGQALRSFCFFEAKQSSQPDSYNRRTTRDSAKHSTNGRDGDVRQNGRRNSRRLPRAKVPFRHPLLWRSASMYPEDACDARAGRAVSARSTAESRQPPSTGGSRSAEKKPRRAHRELWDGGGRRCMHAQ